MAQPSTPTAMPKYWMITNRNVNASGLGNHRDEKLKFYTADRGPIDQLTTWISRSEKQFRLELTAQAEAFPLIPEGDHERQKHVTLLSTATTTTGRTRPSVTSRSPMISMLAPAGSGCACSSRGLRMARPPITSRTGMMLALRGRLSPKPSIFSTIRP